MTENQLRGVRLLCQISTAIVLASCGGGSSSPAPSPQPMQNSAVTILLSSRGNDRLSQYIVTVGSLTLMNQSGIGVDVFVQPHSAEFMHLNGGTEPLMTATVPQDVYVSASVNVTGAQFTCVTFDSADGLSDATFANDSPNATVNLPAPIRIAEANDTLVLELQVSESEQYAACDSKTLPPGTTQTFSVTPTFNLTAAGVSSQSTNSANGKATSLAGLVSSIGATQGEFAVTTDYGLVWNVSASSNTVFQGITAFSALAAGMPVDMDIDVQPDGSLVATRVAVVDTDTANLSTFRGPLAFVDQAASVLYDGPLEDQGQFLTTAGSLIGVMPINFSGAAFNISGRFGNLQQLPFNASFTAANIVAGQNVYITNHLLYFVGPNYDPASTITLMPQTVSGTVVGISSSGGFTTYTVELAAYDAFPTLSVQPAQTTLLQNPGTIIVYADADTQMLNTMSIATGSVLRFNGLVFNDNGTLRMDCAEVLDGAAL